MKLRDLDGRFVYAAAVGRFRLSDNTAVEEMQGVHFQCPSCGAGKERGEKDGRGFIRGAHYILVLFANPRGVDPAPVGTHKREDGTENPRWTITSGSTLDDLSLTPSVNCDIPWKDKAGVAHPSSCKFHGHLKNGDVA